ncbi:hypothetical protein HK097_010316 [Rhizophlyctis rosea]|uniref:Galactose oxidase n=1 Tax=Rhizophlyctis rosea TaxID=64517 RepID=A0AAD5X384_9FUNG|nr:hypothetical protein HK097_010316 [Rhizophlyctis rosea]
MSTSTWAKPAVKASVSGVDIPKGRASHSINVIKDNLYVFSGEHEPRVPIDARLHVFNLPSQQWTPAIQPSSATPSPRVGHGSVTFNDTIYIFGGRVGAEMNPLNDMYEFEPANGHWAKVEQSGDIPQARSYFSMAASEKYIYIFGGCPTSGRLNDLHRFNPSTKIWESLPASSSLSPRGGAGLAYLNGKIYVHGGFNGKELSDIWSFDEGTKVWEELEVVGEKPEGRSVHGFVSLKERGVLVCLYGERDPSPTGHVGAGK